MDISWSLPNLPPWMSVLGYKLHWDAMPPKPAALKSFGVETLSVEVDLSLTGLVLSVCGHSTEVGRAGSGAKQTGRGVWGACVNCANDYVYFDVRIVHACVTDM